ncbi:MAG: ABC transporter substrate-binding protein [Anaerolineae bacterium]
MAEADSVAPETPVPSTTEGVAKRLQRLVPKEFAQQLMSTRGQVGRERRTVTILFSDVKGSTALAEHLDPEDVMEIMDGAFDVLIEPVYRHEGTLARLMGDAVLAFFGAPVAHEDDPERAVRAALEIAAGTQRYAETLERERGIEGFSVRIGIHTGLVVVGEVGSDLRVEYTAMGDAINVASRLEQNAPPGGILISHNTYRHLRGVFDVLTQEPLLVKGRTDAVQTYLVEGAKPRAFHKPVRGVEGIETRMVGREAELKHLREAFHTAVEDRELQVVTVVGEAGVGKSRLLHEFDTWSELLPEQFYYFQGRAVPEMQNVPYGLVRDLVAFRFQIQDSDPAAMVRRKLEQGVAVALGEGEDSRRAAHLIGRLAGFETQGSGFLAGEDDAQALRDRALGHLAGYFKGMASRLPVLILLEDLHWADASSLDALNHLALALAQEPAMIVGAARPALFERRPHWGEGQPVHTRLHLQPLSRWDSRRLVAEILQKVPEVPEAFRDLIVSGTEGNPFFIEELIKMLVEDGVIVKGVMEWRLEPSRLAEVRVPPTLSGVLQARLDRLPVGERTVLQQASVVGRLFWDRAVERISASTGKDAEEGEVAERLSALRSREMVFQRETSAFVGAEEYIFKHNMLREIAYEGVLKRVRRVYHGLVADWLLEQGGERVEEYVGLIADHLELAGRVAEAADTLIAAGDRARGLVAHQEAIRAYERALALLMELAVDSDAPEREYERAARTQMKLGLTHHSVFNFGRAQQAYEEGFTLWQRAGQSAAAGSVPPAPRALRIIGSASAPLTLDPGLCYDAPSASVIEQLFSGLVEHTPELGVVPDVAASWEMLDGGRKYVFHLRDDVVWSDGTPVTAHDFAYAWKRVLDPATESRNASLLYDVRGARAYHDGLVREAEAVGVQALDGVTLMVELEGPIGYFLHLLAYSATYPVPRRAVERHGAAWAEAKNLVTNGPFTLASWRRGESMVLERCPHYRGRFRGNVARVKVTLLPPGDRATRLEMYDAGLVDILDLRRADIEDLDLIRQRHAGEYITTPSANTAWLAFDVSRAPFDDPRVRRAFAQAVDREAMEDVPGAGFDAPATGGFVPPGMPGHSPGIALPYNPELARQLLAEAGYPGGTAFPSLDALTPRGPTWHRINEYLRAQWRENLGVDIRWQELEFTEFVHRFFGHHGHLFRNAWVADYPDPDSFLRVFMQTRTEWRHGPYLELVERARRTVNQGERMRLYARAERILADEVPILPLAYQRQHLLLKPSIRGYQISAIGRTLWRDVVIEPH